MPCRAREPHIQELLQSAWSRAWKVGRTYPQREECKTKHSEVHGIEPARGILFGGWDHTERARVVVGTNTAEYEKHRYSDRRSRSSSYTFIEAVRLVTVNLGIRDAGVSARQRIPSGFSHI